MPVKIDITKIFGNPIFFDKEIKNYRNLLSARERVY